MKTGLKIAGVVLLAGLAWFVYLAVRAHLNLVTLNVREADVREVVRKVERQTWETILVHGDVQGPITLKVKNAPLEEVLEILGRQSRARWIALYPLYSRSASLGPFQKIVRGELTPAEGGWTNLTASLAPRPRWLLAQNEARQNDPITLQVSNRELRLAVLALSRFGNVSIVPEDGLMRSVDLDLERASMDRAVKQLAKRVHRKWTSYYALLPLRPGAPAPTTELAQGPPPGEMPSPPGMDPPSGPPGPGPERPMPPRLTKEQQEQREQDYQALLEVLPTEQRARLESERRLVEAMRSSGPGQPQSALQTTTDASSEERVQQRKKNLLRTTPEQRVQQDRRDSRFKAK